MLKPVHWVGGSKKDLLGFPEEVQEVAGYALYLAQNGGKGLHVKPLKDIGGCVFEIIEDHDGNTYRVVYSVAYDDVVYLLHAFQKKSKQGIATPKQDIDLIKRRMRWTLEHYERSKT